MHPTEQATIAFGNAFLTLPGSAVETERALWGTESLRIDFPGGPYAFLGLCSSQCRWVHEKYLTVGGECAADPSPVESRLYRVPREFFKRIDICGWEYTYDRDYHAEYLLVAGLDWFGRIDFKDFVAGALWTSQESPEGFPGVFENFFRILVAYRIARMGGVLLHSAAIADGKRAFVLVGHSGAGKSTSSRLALQKGWEVLSDDLNVVFPVDGRWMVEKMPFSGDLGQTPARSRSFPVAGVFLLEKAQEHGICHLPMARLLARSLACAPVLNEDPFRLDSLLSNLSGLLHSCGRGALRFAKNPEFIGMMNEE